MMGEELVRQGAPRIVEHRSRTDGRSFDDRIRFDNGLYLELLYGGAVAMSFNFSLLGAADGSIMTPPIGEKYTYGRKIIGYKNQWLERSRSPLNTLPLDVVQGFAQVRQELLNPVWSLNRHVCMSDALLAKGFPAWIIWSSNQGGPKIPAIGFPDYESFAPRILGQIDDVRRLLEAAARAAPRP